MALYIIRHMIFFVNSLLIFFVHLIQLFSEHPSMELHRIQMLRLLNWLILDLRTLKILLKFSIFWVTLLFPSNIFLILFRRVFHILILLFAFSLFLFMLE